MDRYGQYVKGARRGRHARSAASCPRAAKAREPRRPSGEPNISGDWAPEQVVMVDPRGAGGGLVPLSTLADGQAGRARRRRRAPGRRAAGRAAALRRHRADAAGGEGGGGIQARGQPALQLPDHEHPFDWTFDGPVNRITQNKDTIVIAVRPDGPEADDLHEPEGPPAPACGRAAPATRSGAGRATCWWWTRRGSCPAS